MPGLVLLVGFSGAIYTARQYERTKRVRAVDLAISLVGQLDTLPELAFACQALDWGVGPLIVPERYRALLARDDGGDKPPNARQRGEVADHDVVLMSNALKLHLSFDLGRQPLGLIYRYCFDKLFAHLANIERLIAGGQLDEKDLRPLAYWLSRIAHYEYLPAGMSGEEVFQPFVKCPDFDYAGVISLGKRLGVANWDYAPPRKGYGSYSNSPPSSTPA